MIGDLLLFSSLKYTYDPSYISSMISKRLVQWWFDWQRTGERPREERSLPVLHMPEDLTSR